MKQRRAVCLVLFRILCIQCVARSVQGATYKVGHDLVHDRGHTYGWGRTTQVYNRDGSPYTYDNWAARQTFYVGDVLEFDYDPTLHDVTNVLSTGSARCRPTAWLTLDEDGYTRSPLDSNGTYIFTSVGNGYDCNNGMFLQVVVFPVPMPSPIVTSPPPPGPGPGSGGLSTIAKALIGGGALIAAALGGGGAFVG